MREITANLFDEMRAWPWFAYVGQVTTDPKGILVKSWDEACRRCRQPHWENLGLDTKNRFVEEVCLRNWERSQTWNPVVQEIKNILPALIETFSNSTGSGSSLPDALVSQVQHDCHGILMETDFEDVYPPIFYRQILARWYRSGRFPCGWDGPTLKPGWKGDLPSHRIYVF